MRCDTGQFKDKRGPPGARLHVRPSKLIQQLFQGKAELGNDHVIAPVYPYFDPSVPQRAQDIDKAKQLLSEAGVDEPDGRPARRRAAGDPGPGHADQEPGAAGRHHPQRRRREPRHVLRRAVVPGQAGRSAVLRRRRAGIVDYGHRATPDVYLNAALKTKGIWNSSQYSHRTFDAPSRTFQTAVGVDAQKAACKKIETILIEDMPIGLPYFYNYLAGNSKEFTGVSRAPSGQMFFSTASQGRLTDVA